jgi:hypothetical protein
MSRSGCSLHDGHIIGTGSIIVHLRQGLLGEAPSDAPYHYVQMLDGLRLIVLDSSVAGVPYGQLGDAQLAWLGDQLRRPSPRGTLLALHHPPFRGTVPLLNTIMLRDREALADILRGSDVRAILAGHVHYPSAAGVAGIPCFTAPAIAYQIDPLDQAGYLGFAGYGCNLVQVFDDSVVASSILLHGDLPELFRRRISNAEWEARIATITAPSA